MAISDILLDPINGENIEFPESMIGRIIGVDGDTIKGIQKEICDILKEGMAREAAKENKENESKRDRLNVLLQTDS